LSQKPFVLVVEDDAQLRKVIAANLVEHGYLVLQAESFRQAIDRLAIKPQLMILDIRLPDATGWDVAQWAESISASAPTIIISGSKPEQGEMKRFGTTSYLPKPFAIRQLMELVELYTPAA
jgi:two-component system KDP operon response regulator KdpE